MAWTTAAGLLVLWALGVTGECTIGGGMDLLVILPIGMVLVNLIVGGHMPTKRLGVDLRYGRRRASILRKEWAGSSYAR